MVDGDGAGEVSVDLSGQIDSAVDDLLSKEEGHTWLQKVKGVIEERRQQAAPWREFADVRTASKPPNGSVLVTRLSGNFSKFKSNYALVGLGFCCWVLLTSPLLIIALGLLAFTAGMAVRGGGDRSVMGITLSKDDQLKAAAALTIPLLWLSGATSAVFWVLGATAATVAGHAAVMPIEGEDGLPISGGTESL